MVYGGSGGRAMKFDGKIGGFEDMHRLLQQLPKNVQNRVVQQAATVGLRAARGDIKNAAPRHEGEQSQASKKYGTIRNNIKVVKKRRVKRGQKGARIHTGKAFWANFYEKGTRYQPARPWFAPAFTAAVPKIIDAMAAKMREGLLVETEKFRNGRK